ncbi:MAG: glycerate kinase [Gemmatimonadota bacterium]|nr:glycerate kinase [Gemmatimonadota bacterium]
MTNTTNSGNLDASAGGEPGTVLMVAQAFKETHTVREIADAMARGADRAGFPAEIVLGADGGNDFVQVLDIDSLICDEILVTGPLKTPVSIAVPWLEPGVAALESSLVCGLALVSPEERNPAKTTTRGLGEAVTAIAELGAHTILVGLGGSATMDGGTGMASAWGWRFEDEDGYPIPEGGGHLGRLARIVSATKPDVELVGIADVQNCLFGPSGARVYARQKGADPETEDILDGGLMRLAEVLNESGPGGLAHVEGAGAAGGLGFGLMAFGGAKIIRGAEWVLERVGFDGLLARARAVLVAEAGFDRTSGMGKLSGEVLARALSAGVPVGLVAPTASQVPAGVAVETGGGFWDLEEVALRTESLLNELLRLPQG